MITDLRYPNINGKTTNEQMEQTRRYLHQLVDQLNIALQSVGSGSAVPATVIKDGSVSKAESENDAVATFNDIKALIIKSADIVNAYYDEINTRLEGVYVAESDFGSYAEQTSQDILANSISIQQLFTNIQAVVTDVDNLEHRLIEANAYINSGLLYNDPNSGVPVYGLEIGQRNTIDGVDVFNNTYEEYKKYWRRKHSPLDNIRVRNYD